jgi:hypothetical protein
MLLDLREPPPASGVVIYSYNFSDGVTRITYTRPSLIVIRTFSDSSISVHEPADHVVGVVAAQADFFI